LISREIVCQRRLRRIATEYAGAVKLPDYLRSDTKDVNPLSLTAVIICLATINYQKIIHRRKSGRPIQVNEAFHGIEKRCLIKRDNCLRPLPHLQKTYFPPIFLGSMAGISLRFYTKIVAVWTGP
jgi:hypothetical protein